MKITCGIIRDLLPLYLDGVCSNDSKTAVEEHITVCDDCRIEFQDMQTTLPINNAEQNLKEAEAVANLSKRWKKGMKKTLLKGVLITLAVIVILALIVFIFADVRITTAYGGDFMSQFAITAEGIQKKYGSKPVLQSISVNIKRGEIYGLVGKNGSGKTTLFRILTGLIQEYEGIVSINQIDGRTSKVSAVINSPSLFLNMSATQNMKAQAYLLGICDNKKIEQTLTMVGLKGCGNKAVKNFSLGMMQRLKLGMALLDNPDILFLDEPSNGLDPDGIAELRELLLEINRISGITLLISSHILNELEKTATLIGFLHEGKIIKEWNTYEIHQSGTTLEAAYLEYIKGERT